MRGTILPLAGAAMLAAGPSTAAEQWTPVARDPAVQEVPFDPGLFKADPEYTVTYDPEAQIEIYGGKSPVDNPKPPIEIGRGLYDPGPIGDGIALFGRKNQIYPAFSVFGDLRFGVAFNDNGDREAAVAGARANLNFNLELTGTERIHMFWQPVSGGDFRWEFAGDDESDFLGRTDDEPTAFFFEGDAGAITSSIRDEYTSWDLPFAVGLVPMLLQNGVWMDDAFLGGAVTIPAQNSPALDITNFDVTFFGGWDKVTSRAFTDNTGGLAEHDADIYGVTGFFDVAEGYAELGYAYLNDTDDDRGGDRSYHNLTAAFSKRYQGLVANAVRGIVNVGQDDPAGAARRTANGGMLIVENAFITRSITLVPYANFFAGIDTPQKAAGDTGLLKNVGLSYETDGLTGFPRLNDTGHDALGGALGIEYLFGLEQQIVGEVAFQTPWDDRQGIPDSQFAVSARYQRPLTNRLIFRADAIYGWLFDLPNIAGVRAELRLKL